MRTNNSALPYQEDMGNMIEGDVYVCEVCSLELKVAKPCDEEDCDLICCEKQMKKAGS